MSNMYKNEHNLIEEFVRPIINEAVSRLNLSQEYIKTGCDNDKNTNLTNKMNTMLTSNIYLFSNTDASDIGRFRMVKK